MLKEKSGIKLEIRPKRRRSWNLKSVNTLAWEMVWLCRRNDKIRPLKRALKLQFKEKRHMGQPKIRLHKKSQESI